MPQRHKRATKNEHDDELSAAGMDEWLANVRCEILAEKLDDLGVETPPDLLLLDPEDVEELLRDLKKVPKKKFLLALKGLQSSDLGGTSESSADEVFQDVQELEPEPSLLYTSPSPRDRQKSRMPSSA